MARMTLRRINSYECLSNYDESLPVLRRSNSAIKLSESDSSCKSQPQNSDLENCQALTNIDTPILFKSDETTEVGRSCVTPPVSTKQSILHKPFSPRPPLHRSMVPTPPLSGRFPAPLNARAPARSVSLPVSMPSQKRTNKSSNNESNGRPPIKSIRRHSMTSSLSPEKSWIRPRKTVSFGIINIMEFPVELGDNPSVHDGCPLTIGWKVQRNFKYRVDVYENLRLSHRRRTRKELRLSAEKRNKILIDQGHTIEEMAVVILEIHAIKNSREVRVQNHILDRFYEAVLMTGHKLKKAASKSDLGCLISPKPAKSRISKLPLHLSSLISPRRSPMPGSGSKPKLSSKLPGLQKASKKNFSFFRLDGCSNKVSHTDMSPNKQIATSA